MQDQLQTMRRLIAFQQAESKRLSEQITTLTETVEGLRQTFASARSVTRLRTKNGRARCASRQIKIIVKFSSAFSTIKSALNRRAGNRS